MSDLDNENEMKSSNFLKKNKNKIFLNNYFKKKKKVASLKAQIINDLNYYKNIGVNQTYQIFYLSIIKSTLKHKQNGVGYKICNS